MDLVEASINSDGIPPERCSLRCPSVDDAVQIVHTLGMSTQLARWDVKNTYRIVPTHPLDRELLGMSWNVCIFIGTVLLFRLWSALKILFMAVADAL